MIQAGLKVVMVKEAGDIFTAIVFVINEHSYLEIVCKAHGESTDDEAGVIKEQSKEV